MDESEEEKIDVFACVNNNFLCAITSFLIEEILLSTAIPRETMSFNIDRHDDPILFVKQIQKTQGARVEWQERKGRSRTIGHDIK